jgi:hypothetical protein
MKYLHLIAAGHDLVLDAAQVVRVTSNDEAGGDEPAGGSLLDLTVLPARPEFLPQPGRVRVECRNGATITVHAVRALVDLHEADFAPVLWLPPPAGSLVDAVLLREIGGSRPWRLRNDLAPEAI